MEFQSSMTYTNLKTAYEAELTASARDLIYGDKARQEDYIEVANLFNTLSKNNKEHARIWLRRMNGGTIPSTLDLLYQESQSESYYGNVMYRQFAQIALEEGFPDIAALFSGVANIDLNHSVELLSFFERIERGELLCSPTNNLWICMQCGNVLSDTCAPTICPVCGFPQGFYRNYSSCNQI